MAFVKDFGKKRFWVRFSTQALSCVGFFSVLAGIVAALFPAVLPPAGELLAASALLVSIGYGLFRSWPRPVQQSYITPNTEIAVVEGDLFDQKGNVVIGMTTTFDTEIPHIIHEGSIQAQFLGRVYRNDRDSLDKALDDALADCSPLGEFRREDRKLGKQVIYPLGTVAVVSPAIRHLFFCVAYSEMNKRNEAHATVDGIWRSLANLWNEVRARGNGETVSIAVIGGGQSRISQHFPAQDSIRFIALSYIFASRVEKIASRLNIVVRKGEIGSLDMLELQAFLNSLKPS